MIEIDKSVATSGENMRLEGSSVNTNISRSYNNELHKIESINYIGDACLVNELSKDEEYNEQLEEKTQSNILDVELNEININTETSIEYTKNITDIKIITFLDEVFSKMEIIKYNESEYNNSTLRILNSIPYNNVKVTKRSENKIWNKVNLYKNRKEAIKEINKLRKLNPYLFSTTFNYAYNIFKTNIFGLKLQLQVVESINIENGEIKFDIVLTIGLMDFTYNFKTFDTGINRIINYSQQMTKKFIELLKNSNKEIINLNKEYSQDLIQYEKDLKEFIQNPYDFSNLYREPYNDLYDSIKNFTTDTFNELVKTINFCHTNYSLLLNQIKKGEDISINEIRNIIEQQYFTFIEKMTNNLEVFYNDSIKYLKDIETLITENFQIDVLYDINDNVIKVKKIFIKFVDLLFKSIEKGMAYFKSNLEEYIDNLIGDLLQYSQFIAEALNENEILRNALEKDDITIIIKNLKDLKNIVNGITFYLYKKIDDDYDTNFNNGNKNNIKNSIIIKVNKIKEIFDNESSNLLKKIKRLIKYMELYELYISHLDKIDNINNKLQNTMYNDTYEKLFKTITKTIEIKYNKDLLNKKSEQIVDYLQKEIKEINIYISAYIKQYQIENKYKMLSNMTKINKYFLLDEMKKLMNDYYNLILETVDIKIKEVIFNNYDKGIVYINNVYNRLLDKRHKDVKGVGNRFLNIVPKFMTNNAQLLSQILADFPILAKKHYTKIKDDIFKYFEEKLKKIDKYYLKDEIYKDFIDLYTNEINNIKDNIKLYFNEDVFSNELYINITNYTNEKTLEMDQNKNKEFKSIYDKIMRIQDFPIGSNCDYFWRWIVKIWKVTIRRTFRRYVDGYGPISNQLIKNLNGIDEYLEQKRIIFVNNFTQKFENYINNYVDLGKKPYEFLNDYIANKLI